MTPSRLEVPDHAQERLKQRQITRQQVRDCLYKGFLIGTDLKGRRTNQKTIGKRTLIVVYLEVLGGHVVITAYWKGIE